MLPMNLLSGFEGMFFAAINHRPMATQKKGHWGFIRYMLLLGIFDENSALGLKTSGMPRAREVSMRFVFGCLFVFSGICVYLPGLKSSGLPRAIGVRARLPPMKIMSAMHKAASRWLNTLCISLAFQRYFGYIYNYYCIIYYLISYVQGGQQVVEYVVHLSGREKKHVFLCSLLFSEIFDSFHIFCGLPQKACAPHPLP